MKRLAVILSLALLVAAMSLADSRLTEALKLESVALEADGEGYAWPDSPLTMTFNRPLPDGWLERSLRLSPPVVLTLTEMGRQLVDVESALNLDQAIDKARHLVASRGEASVVEDKDGGHV